MRTCSRAGCHRAHHAQQLCQAHYRKAQRARQSGTNLVNLADYFVPDSDGSTGVSRSLSAKRGRPVCKDCGARGTRSVTYWRWDRRTRLDVTLHFCAPCLDGGYAFIQNLIPAKDLVIA